MDEMVTTEHLNTLGAPPAVSPDVLNEMTIGSRMLTTLAIKVCAAWTLHDKSGGIWAMDTHYATARGTQGAPMLSVRITNQRGVVGFRLSLTAPYDRMQVDFSLPPSVTLRGEGAPYPIDFLLTGHSFVRALPETVSVGVARAERYPASTAADIWRRMVTHYLPYAVALAQAYERETGRVTKTRMASASLCRRYGLWAKEHPQVNEIHLHEPGQPFASFIVDADGHVRTARLFMLTISQIAVMLGRPFQLTGEG